MNQSGPSRGDLYALVAFPIVLLVSDALRMGTSEISVDDMMRDVAAHRERWFAGTCVGMVGIALSGKGARAIVSSVRERMPRFTAASMFLVILGVYAGIVLMTTDLIPWLATDERADPGARSIVHLVYATDVLAPFYASASCHALGFLLLAIPMWRLGSRWRIATIALVLAPIVFLAGRITNTDSLRFAGDVAFLVVAALVVRQSLRNASSSAPL